MFKWITNNKTHLVAISGAVSAIAAFATGQISIIELGAAIWGALGLSALRSGVKTEAAKASVAAVSAVVAAKES